MSTGAVSATPANQVSQIADLSQYQTKDTGQHISKQSEPNAKVITFMQRPANSQDISGIVASGANNKVVVERYNVASETEQDPKRKGDAASRHQRIVENHPYAEIFSLNTPNIQTNWTEKPWFPLYSNEMQHMLTLYPDPSAMIKERGWDSLQDLWNEALKNSPNEIAFTGLGPNNSQTYAQVDQKSGAFAAHLESQVIQGHIEQGGKVMVVMPSSPEFVIAVQGIQKAGLVPVAVLAGSNQAEMENRLLHCIKLTNCEAIVGMKTPTIVNAITEVKSQLVSPAPSGPNDEPNNEPIASKNIQLYFSGIWGAKNWRTPVQAIKSTLGKRVHKLEERPRDSFSFHKIVNSGAKPQCSHISETQSKLEQPAMILFTSGTSGPVKAMALTHKNLLVNALQLEQWLKADYPTLDKSNPHLLFPLPTGHAFGALISMVVTPVMGARTHLVLNPRDPAHLNDAFKKRAPFDMFFGVDKFYQTAINKYGDRLRSTYSQKPPLAAISGASATKNETRVKVSSTLGVNIREGYGMTETSIAGALQDVSKPQKGYLPMPWNDYLIVDKDAVIEANFDPKNIVVPLNGQRIPEGEMLFGGNVALEYLNNPDASASTFIKDCNGRNWVRTGDIVTADEADNGRFKIVGREKETIIVGGANITPDSIENYAAMPKITEILVCRLPKKMDTLAGDDNILMLVKGTNISKQNILDQMYDQGAMRHQCPRSEHIVFLDATTEMPQTVTLKNKRVQLTNHLVEHIKANFADDHVLNEQEIDTAVKAVITQGGF